MSVESSSTVVPLSHGSAETNAGQESLELSTPEESVLGQKVELTI